MEYHANGRGGALRHATYDRSYSLSSLFSKEAGLSCSITTAGSWLQSPTVLAANELRSPDEDAPIRRRFWHATHG